MRKLLIVGIPCLVLGLPDAAPAAGGTAGPTMVGGTTVGTATAGGVTITGTTVGISGTRGGPRPIVGGQPANFLNGTTGNVTSRRAACPPGDLDAAGCRSRR